MSLLRVCLLHTHTYTYTALTRSHQPVAIYLQREKDRDTRRQHQNRAEKSCLYVFVRFFFLQRFKTSLLISAPITNFQKSLHFLKKSHLSFQVSACSVYLSHECCSHVASWEVMGFLCKKINTAAGEESRMDCEREAYNV